ncbi:hypothetical protein SDJN03_16149, partial [Cucurbita argyrosperma subsp. sororia]
MSFSSFTTWDWDIFDIFDLKSHAKRWNSEREIVEMKRMDYILECDLRISEFHEVAKWGKSCAVLFEVARYCLVRGGDE